MEVGALLKFRRHLSCDFGNLGGSAMPDTILRHWHMLRFIPRAPRKVAVSRLGEILEERGFTVDRRSIQRDLVKLSSFFPLICDDRSKPYGWSWLRDSDPFDLPGMDAHGALSFRLAAEHLAHLLPATTRSYLEPYFRRATGVLDRLDTEKMGGILGSWPAKVRVIAAGLARVAPPIDAEVNEAVQSALLRERRLWVSYRRRGETTAREFDVSPLALVHRETVAYLVATARDYDDIIQLALHRIDEAEMLDEPRHERSGFDIDQYIQGGAFDFPVGEEAIVLEACFAPQVIPSIVEAPLSDDQCASALEDGRLHVVATVADTNQLRAWLRGFGPYVEVLAPPALREEMRAAARATFDLYDDRRGRHDD